MIDLREFENNIKRSCNKLDCNLKAVRTISKTVYKLEETASSDNLSQTELRCLESKIEFAKSNIDGTKKQFLKMQRSLKNELNNWNRNVATITKDGANIKNTEALISYQQAEQEARKNITQINSLLEIIGNRLTQIQMGDIPSSSRKSAVASIADKMHVSFSVIDESVALIDADRYGEWINNVIIDYPTPCFGSYTSTSPGKLIDKIHAGFGIFKNGHKQEFTIILPDFYCKSFWNEYSSIEQNTMRRY